MHSAFPHYMNHEAVYSKVNITTRDGQMSLCDVAHVVRLTRDPKRLLTVLARREGPDVRTAPHPLQVGR